MMKIRYDNYGYPALNQSVRWHGNSLDDTSVEPRALGQMYDDQAAIMDQNDQAMLNVIEAEQRKEIEDENQSHGQERDGNRTGPAGEAESPPGDELPF